MSLFDSVGLTINVQKSVLVPTQRVEFLGVLLDSSAMTVTLPVRIMDRSKNRVCYFLRPDTILFDLTSVFGLTVASDPAVKLAPIRYKYLEIFKNRELARNHGDYKVKITLDVHARSLVNWWIHNITFQSKFLCSSSPQLELFADASLTGWGAAVGASRTGGHWVNDELCHIIYLELKAILLGLQSLCRDCVHSHIRFCSDNITVVACLVRCGSMKLRLHELTEGIFSWTESCDITLLAVHIPGLHYVATDRESRLQTLDLEWMLRPHIFEKFCQVFYIPDIDFVFRINAQVATYVSWKPDPSATYINAFFLNWAIRSFYAFPPFSLFARVLRKLQEDQATLLVVLPLWPTQVWFPRALQLLVLAPFLLPRHPLVLPQDPSYTHP